MRRQRNTFYSYVNATAALRTVYTEVGELLQPVARHLAPSVPADAVRIGQLTARGLTPLQTRSLVGCLLYFLHLKKEGVRCVGIPCGIVFGLVSSAPPFFFSVHVARGMMKHRFN